MINRNALRIRYRKGLRQCKRRQYPAERITPAAIGRAGTTPVSCSCLLCGNYRRVLKGKDKLTMQERRALAADKDHDYPGAGGQDEATYSAEAATKEE